MRIVHLFFYLILIVLVHKNYSEQSHGTLTVESRRDGRITKKTYTNFRMCDGGEVAVEDEPLFKHGSLSAYRSPMSMLLIVENDETIYCMRHISGWNLVGFVKGINKDYKGEECVLFEMSSYDTRRFFDVRRRKEVYLVGELAPLTFADSPPPRPGRTLNIVSKWSGRDSDEGEAKIYLISTHKDWDRTWSRFSDSALSHVDFETQMVVAVFLGQTFNTDGVIVDDFRDLGKEAVLRLRRASFQTTGGAIKVRPYGVFVLQRIQKLLRVEIAQQKYIGGPVKWKELAQFECK